jgi:hypothetical protein
MKQSLNRAKLICLSVALLTGTGVGVTYAEDLAKASQNPIGNIVSLPVEVWHYDGMPAGTEANMVVAKPVYPLTVGSINIINRLIIPYIDLDGPDAGADFGKVEIPRGHSGDRNGWGNFQYQAFFTPAKPGKVIMGAGPVLDFPTHTDGLGSDKWSAGVGAVALSMPGSWVVGGLLQNIWSYAGPDSARSVNKMTFQYFINYNFDKGWYLTSTPIITANWEADSDNRWTVPVGGGFGRLVKLGQQPVDFKLQAFSNVESTDNGPDWSAMLAVKFLFPK